MTTDPPPPTCCATVPTGTCGRLASWVVTGEAFSGEELVRFFACSNGQHQAACRQRAWEVYHVVIVKTRKLPG